MKILRFLGIDPGMSGAMTVLDEWGEFIAGFTFKKTTAADLKAILDDLKPYGARAYLEKFQILPKQGISSTASFVGQARLVEGVVIGVGIPYELVRPQVWQKDLGCLSKGDKNVTKAKAQALWPQVKWTHATADSALIAEWGRRQWHEHASEPPCQSSSQDRGSPS